VVVFALLAMACGGMADAPVPTITVQHKYGSPDDEYVAIAEVVPGFAGLYLDPDHTLVMMLVDASQANRARIGVTQVFGDDTSNARVHAAKFDSIQLVGWKYSFGMSCWLTGVVALDADEVRNLVVVGATADASPDAIHACASAQGIPADALDIVADAPAVLQ